MNVFSQVGVTSAISYVYDMCSVLASCEMIAQRATRLLALKPLLSNNIAQDSSIACLGSCLHAGVCTSVNISAQMPWHVRRCGLGRFQGKFGGCRDDLGLVLYTLLHREIEM